MEKIRGRNWQARMEALLKRRLAGVAKDFFTSKMFINDPKSLR